MLAVLQLDRTTADFGGVVVGRASSPIRFTVTNNGTGASSVPMVTAGGEFSVMGTTCSAAIARNATCTIDVIFRPTGVGPRSGTLTVSATNGGMVSASLTGSGVPAGSLEATPTSLSFPSTLVGATSTPVSVTIRNGGGASVTGLTAMTSTMDFVIPMGGNRCGMELGAGSSCIIDVVFSPKSEGTLTGTLTVSGMGGATIAVGLNGTGLGAARLIINPTIQTFAASVGAQSAGQQFTIANSGGAATGAVTVAISGPEAAEFSISSGTCAAPLAVAGSCTVTVVFSPATAGSKMATLTAMASPGGSVAATLMGNSSVVVPPAAISMSPPSINFGSLAINTTSGDQPFTVSNSGGQASGPISIALGGANASQFEIGTNNCNAPLPPNTSCTISVRFRPTTNGDKAATLTVTASPGGTVVSTLSGSGLAVNVTLTGGGGFGNSVVGFDGAIQQTYTVTNAGMANTGMLAATISGNNPADWRIVSNGCTTLDPGQLCQIVVAFRATAVGVRNGFLTVMAPVGGTVSAALTGTGLAQVEITPTSYDFGPVTLGRAVASTPFVMTIRAPLTGGAAAITSGSADYSTTALTDCDLNFAGGPAAPSNTNFSAVVPADATTYVYCDVTVTFLPVNPRGAKPGVLTVSAGGQSAAAGLTGVGAGPLRITPTSSDFGNVLVGAESGIDTFTVSNDSPVGGADITAVTATFSGGDFVVVRNECANDTLTANNANDCEIDVKFTPTSTGNKSGTITVTGTFASVTETATATVTGTGISSANAISLSSDTTNFGSVPLTATRDITFTVTNPSNGVTSGAIIPTAGGLFSVPVNNCVVPLAPAGTCTFVVRFSPANNTNIQTFTQVLTVTAGAAGTASTTLTATTIQPITINPSSWDFGTGVERDVNGPTKDFTITNSGGVALTVTTDITEPEGADDEDDYVIVNACANPVAANGGTCTVTLRFVPDAGAGASSASLTIDDSAGGSVIVTSARLSGTVVTDANLVWLDQDDDLNLDFGSVRIGVASQSVTLTLKNIGGAATAATPTIVTPLAASAFDVVSSTCTSGPLAAGGTCTVVVNFLPAAVGGVADTLLVQVPARDPGDVDLLIRSDDNTVDIDFSGTGINATGTEYISPAPGNLGAQFPNMMASAVTFTYTNGSAGAVTLGTPFFSVGDVTRFVVASAASNGCSNGLVVSAAGGSCQFTVTFFPQTGDPNDTIEDEVTINTTGTSPSAGVYGRVRALGVLSIAPPAAGADFGQVISGQSSAERTWVVTNVGELTTGTILIGNNDTVNFSVIVGQTTDCQSKDLGVGLSCNVRVRFNPTTTGALGPATITSTSPNVNGGGAVTVATVSGTGVVTAQITGDPIALSFPDTQVGSDYQTLTVDIENRVGVLNVQDTGPLSLSLSNTTDFSMDGGCDAEKTSGLGGGDQCTLTITFNPKSVATTLSGNLTVTASPGGSVTIPLSGKSIPSLAPDCTPGAPGAVCDTEIKATFDQNEVASWDIVLDPLDNATATGPLSVNLSGTGAASWTITMNTCTGKSLTEDGANINDRCVVEVTYTSTGAKAATLTVAGTTSGNVLNLELVGQ